MLAITIVTGRITSINDPTSIDEYHQRQPSTKETPARGVIFDANIISSFELL